jgi:hypothetical protein
MSFQFVDRIVCAVNRWPTFWFNLTHPIIRLLVHFREKEIAQILITRCIYLPEVDYSFIEKHGQNVVYVPHIDGTNNAAVVDYLKETVRRVRNVPDEFQKVGATF